METGIIDSILEIIKFTIPAVAAIVAVHFVLKSHAEKEKFNQSALRKTEETKIILPLRLQAYERICMLIERISPSALIPRVNNGMMTSQQLQQALLSEIRNELNHNLSQQVYLSEKAWKLTKQTTEAVKGLVLKSARELPPENGTGNDLARRILENMMSLDPNPFDTALDLIKSEIQSKF